MKPSLRPTVRTPMALVLMVAIAFGWIGHEARTQRMAVAATKRSGGEVTYSWQKFVGTFPRGAPPASRWLVDQLGCDYFGHLTTVVLNGSAATDDTTRQVARLGRVLELIPDDTTVTDSGLAPLRGLIHLDFLSLDGNPGIKGPGLANIRELRQLRRLNIENTKLDDADLIPVARLTSLTYMNLFYTPITDVGLGHLGNTVNLEALYTSGGMTRLERLDLGGTRVADLSPIRGLSRIGMPMLSRTSVTDSGLAHLVGLTKSRENQSLKDGRDRRGDRRVSEGEADDQVEPLKCRIGPMVGLASHDHTRPVMMDPEARPPIAREERPDHARQDRSPCPRHRPDRRPVLVLGPELARR